MKLLWFVMFFAGTCFSQRKEINWKPCQDVMAQFQDKVEKFNAGRKDGLHIELDCLYSGDPNYKRKPKKHIELTAKEVITLRSLREASHGAYKAQDAYEKYLLAAHHIRERDYGDPCFNFVGFVLDEEFITEDPNPMMADGSCD